MVEPEEEKKQKILKDLGRKARTRREDELRKRPEIVHLDGAPDDRPIERSSFHLAARASQKADQLPDKGPGPQKRRRISKNACSTKQSHFDSWVPCVSGLRVGEQSERSPFVQLHGLPFGSTSRDISRFFVGLVYQRILILPSFSHGMIPELDAKGVPSNFRRKPCVRRYPSSLRVLVQFDTTWTANLAQQRSGEAMILDRDDRDRCAVCVTMLPRKMARFLSKRMAVEAQSNTPLHEVIECIEKETNREVNRVLWETASDELSLLVQPSSESNSIFQLKEALPPSVETLCDRRQNLNMLLQELRYGSFFPQSVSLDPSLLNDPASFLTSQAAECVEMQLRRIDNMLLAAQRWQDETIEKLVARHSLKETKK